MQNHLDYERLVLPLLAGKREAVQAVFDQCFPAMLALVRRGGGNHQDAEDVFMNTLEVFYLLARRPEFQLTSALPTLVYSIGRLQWLKIISKKKNIRLGSDEAYEESMEAEDLVESMQQAERYHLYRQKFAQLGSDCQKLLSMSFQNLSHEVIATTMGFSSEAHARKRKHFCKGKLIQLIRADRRFDELKYTDDE